MQVLTLHVHSMLESDLRRGFVRHVILTDGTLVCVIGLKEGLKQAAQGLSSGLETAASALVYNPVRSVKDGEGVGTAVVRAIKAAPGAIAAPASAAAAATRVTLLGLRNALDPERYEERRR